MTLIGMLGTTLFGSVLSFLINIIFELMGITPFRSYIFSAAVVSAFAFMIATYRDGRGVLEKTILQEQVTMCFGALFGQLILISAFN